MGSTPPYLVRLELKEGAGETEEYPFNLPIIRCLDIEFASSVTFFVGENGTGKSTVIEAIAALCRLPVSRGSRNELADSHGPDTSSLLAQFVRPSFRRRPHSPVLLTFPGAQILSFDGHVLRLTALEETSQFQITKGILQNPGVYWKHLQASRAAQEDLGDTERRRSRRPVRKYTFQCPR